MTNELCNDRGECSKGMFFSPQGSGLVASLLLVAMPGAPSTSSFVFLEDSCGEFPFGTTGCRILQGIYRTSAQKSVTPLTTRSSDIGGVEPACAMQGPQWRTVASAKSPAWLGVTHMVEDKRTVEDFMVTHGPCGPCGPHGPCPAHLAHIKQVRTLKSTGKDRLTTALAGIPRSVRGKPWFPQMALVSIYVA